MKLRRDRPEPRPPRILVEQVTGRIAGYELADGAIVKAMSCCDDPMACERPECWTPFPQKPWWMGP